MIGDGGVSGAPGRPVRRILVTNDDGAGAHGLAALVTAARRHWRPLVFANETGWTGAGTAVRVPGGPPRISRRTAEEWVFADTPPACAVSAACTGLAGPPPDGILVGVNHGPNVGTAMLHSGTVGAAMTATVFGVTAVAVSSDDVHSTGGDEDGPFHHELAAVLAVELLRSAARAGPGMVFSLNVPNLPAARVAGLRLAAPARVHEAVRVVDADILTCDVVVEEAPDGSDVALLRQGFATVTVLHGDAADPRVAVMVGELDEALVRGEFSVDRADDGAIA